jgi:hypothetical protein
LGGERSAEIKIPLDFGSEGCIYRAHRLNLGCLRNISHIGSIALGSGVKKRGKREKREYPPFWDRAVPVLVAVIVLLIVGLIIIASLVALGFI